MKRTFQYFVISSGLLVSSCSEKKPYEALQQEVMAIHDSVMPRMSEIINHEESLQKELTHTDSLLKQHPNDPTLLSRQNQIQRLVENLKGADQAMMHWMHQYKADTLDKLEDKQAELYLHHQKQAIETVRDQMQQSIQQAQTFKP